ncbi:hypothetical protein ACOSQ4_028762 [Xanthoceras sorbifolium]
MSEIFAFSAQPSAKSNVEEAVETLDMILSSKRARAEDTDETRTKRNHVPNSFKSRLLNLSSPNSWSGVSTHRERLQIEEGDITIVDGSLGPLMKISKGELYRKGIESLEIVSIKENNVGDDSNNTTPYGPWLHVA